MNVSPAKRKRFENLEKVPGAIVMRTLKELDNQGRIVRRSTMELTDYNAVEEDQTPRSRLFRRRRAQR